MKKLFVLLASLFLCIFSYAQNNVIEPELQKILNQRNNDYIDVNIMLKAQMSTAELSALNCKSDSKEVRRQVVTNALKSYSEQTQENVMSVIKAEEKNNSVIDVKSFWITNFINCKAKADVIYQLASHPDVAKIIYNQKMEVVNDAEEINTRGVRASSATIGQHITQIQADKVWELGYTGKNVIVAVLDSGVNTEHPDLKDHLWDGNPQHGYNVINPGQDPIDTGSHGTHCAGIVCGDGTSGTMTGVAPDAKLMSIKLYEGTSGLTIDGLTSAIEFASSHGADILSISQGWRGSYAAAYRQTLRSIFDNLLEQGIIAVVAAGNDRVEIANYPVPQNVRTPGDCPPPWLHPDQTTQVEGGLSSVVSVGGVDENNNIMAISSQGPVQWSDYPLANGGLIRPDIVAPGTIYSLSNDLDDVYATKGGTSQAAPCVAGVMALMLEKNPDLSPADLCRIIETTATPLTNKKDNLYGSGLINAFAAVQAVNFNTTEPVINLHSFTSNLTANQDLNFDLTFINNGGGTSTANETVTIETSDTYTTIESNSNTYSAMSAGATAKATFVLSINHLVPDNHIIELTANGFGKTYDIKIKVSNPLVAPVVTATANGTSVNLTWGATNNATGYKIYRDEELLGNTTSTSYTDENLDYSTIYIYTVTSLRDELESEHSQIARVQTGDNPEVPSPTDITANSGNISWTNGTNSIGANIYRKDIVSGVELPIASEISGNSYTDESWNSLPDGIFQYGVSNLYTSYETLYAEDFTNLFLTTNVGDAYPSMNMYWYQYKEGDNNNSSWDIASYITSGPGNSLTFEAFGNAAFIKSLSGKPELLNYLVTRPMTYQEQNIKLLFKYITPTWDEYGTNTLKVMVSTTSYNSGWTELWNSGAKDVTEWTDVEVDLSAYTGKQIYIAFVNVDRSGYCTGIDNVSIAVKGKKESRIEWSANTYKNVNVFVTDGDWSNPSNWSAKRLPNANDTQVIIEANATITSSNHEVNSLIIAEDNTLTLNDGVKLTVNNEFINTNTDAFIINDGAQVVQNNANVAATFNMNINSPTEWSSTNKTGWQFIASPFKNSKIEDFIPTSSDYDLYLYDGTKEMEWLNHKDENNSYEIIIDTIITGSGSETNAYMPSSVNYNYTISQQIYLASELGVSSGNITSYAFKTAKDLGTTITRTYEVYMMNTDKTSFSNGSDWVKVNANNLVFSGDITFSAKDKWTKIEFDTPFKYEDGKNIVLCINDVTGSMSSGSAMTYYTYAASNRVLYARQDGANPYNAYNISNGTRASFVTQAQFIFNSSEEMPELPKAPATPRNLVASATGSSTVMLSWYSSEGATSYNIYQDGIKVATTSQIYHIIEGLKPATNYCFAVTAVGAGLESAPTQEKCATTSSVAPKNLVAEATGETTISLTWDVIADAESYKVYKDDKNIATITGNSYTVKGAVATTEYCFTVTAVTSAGETPASNEACATTFDKQDGDDSGEMQELITIGDGNNSSLTLPFNMNTDYSISQQIYTLEEIGQTGHINGIAFRYKNGFSGTRSIEVYIQHTTKETFTTATDSWESMTNQVYDGDITISGTTDEWISLTFSKTFEYTGGNLVICVYDKTNKTVGETYFHTEQLIENRALAYYPAFMPSSSLTPSNVGKYGYVNTNRNIIQLSFTENGSGDGPDTPDTPDTPVAPAAPEITAAEAISSSAIQLTWGEVANATSYNVYEEDNLIASGIETPTYTVEGLTANTLYCFTVTAVNEDLSSEKSGMYCVRTKMEAPAAPTYLVATVKGTSSVALKWNAPANATSYNIYNGETQIATGITATTHNVEGLTAGTLYNFIVKAVNTGGESTPAEVSALTNPEDLSIVNVGADKTLNNNSLHTPTYDYNHHSMSQQIYTAEDLGGSIGEIHSVSFRLNENTTTTMIRHYEVYLKSTNLDQFDGTNFIKLDETDKVFDGYVNIEKGINDTWFTVTFTTPFEYTGGNLVLTVYDKTGTSNTSTYHRFYTYNTTGRALTMNTWGNSSSYDMLNLTTGTSRAYVSQLKVGMVLDLTPTAPQGLTATATSSSEIALTWNTVVVATSYKVYQEGALIATINETSYTVTGLSADREYCFTVKSSNGVEDSEASEVCERTKPEPPAAPQNVLAESTGETSIQLTWDAVANATSYNIYNNDGTQRATNVTEPTYNVEGLEMDTEYCFTIKAVNAGGVSAASEKACATTDPFSGCYIVFILKDSYQDGWNGNYLEVKYNGITAKKLEYPSSTGINNGQNIYTKTEILPIPQGVDVTVTYTSGGQYTYPAENGFTITYENGKPILDIPIGSFTTYNTENYNFNVDCTPVVPDKPIVKAVSTGDTTIELKISVVGADSYTIYQDSEVIATGLTAETYTVTGLTPDKDYCFTVVAVNEVGNSEISEAACARTFEAGSKTVTIGDGTVEGFYAPISNYGNYAYYSLSQQIYLKDEINSEPCAITSISFQNYKGGPNTRNIVVYMTNVNKDSFVGGTGDWIKVSDADIVYEGQHTFGASGEWTTIEFETPFIYKGKNVCLTVNDKTGITKPADSGPDSFYATDINVPRGVYATSQSAAFDCSNITSVSGALLQIYNYSSGLYYPHIINAKIKTEAADVEIEPVPNAPANLVAEAIDFSSIALTWETTEYASSYNVYQNGELIATEITATNYNVGNLNYSTEYCFTITAVNLEGESAHSASDCATTEEFNGCYITFTLKDTYNNYYGDGWNGNYLDVTYNGNTHKIEFIGSGGSYDTQKTEVLAIPQGAEMTVTYQTAKGGYQSENGFVITYESGEEILNKPVGSFKNGNTSETFGPFLIDCSNSSAKSSAPSEKMTDIKGGFDKASASGVASSTELSKFGTSFQQGVGYLVSYEIESTATFKGTLNHESSYTFDVNYDNGKDLANFNLLGNPFSFNMDWSKVTSSNIASGYAVVNENGGYEYMTSGEIKVGDGFFVKATGSNPTMSYNMRDRKTEENNFLNIVSSGKAGNDNVIVNITSEEQEGFPKIKNFNEDIALIYVSENNNPYGIYNCNKDINEVEVSFKTQQFGKYTIHIEPNGQFEEITLVDLVTNIETNMMVKDYSFTTTSKENGKRFLVRFSMSEGNDNQDNFVHQSGNELIIDAEGFVQIIDVMGRVVYSKDVKSDNNRIDISEFNSAAYIVRLLNSNGAKSQKIVVY